MKKFTALKKIVSLSTVFMFTANLLPNVFAADASSLNVTNMFALWNKNDTLGKNTTSTGVSSGSNGRLTAKAAGTIVNDITMNDDYYYLEGNNTDKVKLIFGSSSTTLVANSTGASKGANYRGITPLKATLSNLSYTKNSTFTSSAISISKGTYTVNVGSGDYSYALGFEISFNNKSKNDAYAMYDLSVAGNNFKVVARSVANDTTDVSAADHDPDENGIVLYGGGDTKYANGTVIYQPTLKFMYDKGASYGIKMDNGVEFVVTKVTKTTSESGNLTLNYSITKDTSLIERYGNEAGGNVLSLDVISGFVNEKIKYNIDLSNEDVLQTITDSQSDKWSDGRKVYVYVVDKNNLETAANASSTDGIISDDRMIVGSIIDGKVVFDIPARYFDNTKEKLMIALKEIDIDKLPAVEGLDLTTSEDENEVVAPIIDDFDISFPEEESFPSLETSFPTEDLSLEDTSLLDESTPSLETSLPSDDFSNFMLDETPIVTPSVVSESTNINSYNTNTNGNNNSNLSPVTTSIPNTGLKDIEIMVILTIVSATAITGFVIYRKKENNA